MKKLLTLTLALLFACLFLNAQPCNDPPAGASPCDAPLIETTAHLDLYCGSTGSANAQLQPVPFCGTVENNQWIRFIAATTQLTLQLNISNCAPNPQGTGLEAEIYQAVDCLNPFTFVSVSNCLHIANGSSGTLNANNLTPGQTYYLMIDGYFGDICSYSVDVINGGVTGCSFGLNLSGLSSQNGEGGSISSFPNGGNEPYTYQWSNGSTQQNLTNLEPGTYSVTVTDASGCHAYGSYTIYPQEFNLKITPGEVTLCAGSGVTFQLMLDSISGYTPDATLSVSGLPPGSSSYFSNNPVDIPSETDLTILTSPATPEGIYGLDIYASTINGTIGRHVTLEVANSLPIPATQEYPANATVNVPLSPIFRWNDPNFSPAYGIQIGNDPLFMSIVFQTDNILVDTFPLPIALQSATRYYWRVKTLNNCGNSVFSAPGYFVTSNIKCKVYAATDLPIVIDPTDTITSTLNITDAGTITDLNFYKLNINHSNINDLTGRLRSPDGTVRTFFRKMCGAQNNMLITFDDEAALTYNEVACPPQGYIAYQPKTPFSAFDGKSVTGAWVFTVIDDKAPAGGQLKAWSLQICRSLPYDSLLVQTSSTPAVCNGIGNGTITVTATGGAYPYYYRLNNGVFQTSNVFNGLTPGIYTIQVRDGLNNVSFTNVNVDALANYTLGFTTTNAGANGGNIDLSITGGGLAPFTYQWSNFYTTQDLLNVPEGFYSVTVTDNSGCKAYGSVALYCATGGNSTATEWIQRINLASVNNNSGNNFGFKDYTNLIANANAGQLVNITLRPGYVGTPVKEFWRIWIDFNRDGDFSDAGELVYSKAKVNFFSDVFQLPATAPQGKTRIRIAMRRDAYPPACGNYAYGETEDYSINIGPNLQPQGAIHLISEGDASPEDITSPEGMLRVFPNPSNGQLQLNIQAPTAGQARILVSDALGRELLTKSLNLMETENQIPLDLSAYANGLYMVTIKSRTWVASAKVMLLNR